MAQLGDNPNLLGALIEILQSLEMPVVFLLVASSGELNIDMLAGLPLVKAALDLKSSNERRVHGQSVQKIETHHRENQGNGW